jgi:hypothetical protein
MSFFALPPAFADGVVDEAIVSLKSNPVFVAEGSPGTTSETAPQLARRLRDNDHLLIVMLPAPVGEEVSDELLKATLMKISDSFEGKKIIGLTIGSSATAVGPTLPAGVVTTMMTRAVTVGTTPAETLGTFIDNIHAWQVLNPEPVPLAPPSPPTPLVGQWWFGALLGAIAGTVLFFAVRSIKHYRMRQREEVGEIRFSAPTAINVRIEELLTLRKQIVANDFLMRDAIMRLCREIEVYFAASEPGYDRPTDGVEERLKWAVNVVKVYLKVQNDPSHYRNVPAEKARRVKGIEQFADRMHDTVVDVLKHDLDDIELDLINLSQD